MGRSKTHTFRIRADGVRYKIKVNYDRGGMQQIMGIHMHGEKLDTGSSIDHSTCLALMREVKGVTWKNELM